MILINVWDTVKRLYHDIVSARGSKKCSITSALSALLFVGVLFGFVIIVLHSSNSSIELIIRLSFSCVAYELFFISFYLYNNFAQKSKVSVINIFFLFSVIFVCVMTWLIIFLALFHYVIMTKANQKMLAKDFGLFMFYIMAITYYAILLIVAYQTFGQFKMIEYVIIAVTFYFVILKMGVRLLVWLMYLGKRNKYNRFKLLAELNNFNGLILAILALLRLVFAGIDDNTVYELLIVVGIISAAHTVFDKIKRFDGNSKVKACLQKILLDLEVCYEYLLEVPDKECVNIRFNFDLSYLKLHKSDSKRIYNTAIIIIEKFVQESYTKKTHCCNIDILLDEIRDVQNSIAAALYRFV